MRDGSGTMKSHWSKVWDRWHDLGLWTQYGLTVGVMIALLSGLAVVLP